MKDVEIDKSDLEQGEFLSIKQLERIFSVIPNKNVEIKVSIEKEEDEGVGILCAIRDVYQINGKDIHLVIDWSAIINLLKGEKRKNLKEKKTKH